MSSALGEVSLEQVVIGIRIPRRDRDALVHVVATTVVEVLSRAALPVALTKVTLAHIRVVALGCITIGNVGRARLACEQAPTTRVSVRALRRAP